MNVVLIVLDTLSALHLPQWGYSRNTLPQLSPLLEKEGFVLFKNAYSTSCWTAPAHASIFTGLYPSEHGVNEVDIRLGEDFYTLAEVLSLGGFKTIGISCNGLIIKELGFSRGFSHYVQMSRWEIFLRARSFKKFKEMALENGRLKAIPMWIWKEKSLKEPLQFLLSVFFRTLKHKLGIGPSVVRYSKPYTEKAFELAKKVYSQEEKFFLFLNIMEVHHRYTPPRPFRGTWSRGTMGKWEKRPPRKHYTRERFPREVVDHLRDLYDEEILFTQKVLADFLAFAKEDREKFDSTLWIITSDHGEAFGEGGHMEHMVSLEDPNIRVPLWVKLPGRGGFEEREDLVQVNDLFPLILDVVESPFPHPLSSVSPWKGERREAVAEIPRLDYLVSLIKNPEDFHLVPRRIIKKGQI